MVFDQVKQDNSAWPSFRE